MTDKPPDDTIVNTDTAKPDTIPSGSVTPESPLDLIDLNEASNVSERTTRTLRRWLKDGRLKKWDGDIQHSGHARVLVSKAELMTLLVVNDQRPRPAEGVKGDKSRNDTIVKPDTGKPDTTASGSVMPNVTPDAIAMEQEINRLRHEAAIQELTAAMDRQRLEAEVKRVQIQSELTAAVQTIAKLRQETERLQSDMDDWRDRHDAREAELNALRSAVGLPWWRRLLPMKEG